MKKILLFMLVCTTVSYAGVRLDAICCLYKNIENSEKGREIFSNFLKENSEYYEKDSSRVQKLIENMKAKKVLFKKNDNDSITLEGFMKETTGLKEIVSNTLHSNDELKNYIKSLISNLKTVKPELTYSAYVKMLDFLETKNERYKYKREIFSDAGSINKDTFNEQRERGRTREIKIPLERFNFYKKLLVSIDMETIPQIPIQLVGIPESIQKCCDRESLKRDYYVAGNREVEGFGTYLLDSLKEELSEDVFFSDSNSSLALALELDEIFNLGFKNKCEKDNRCNKEGNLPNRFLDCYLRDDFPKSAWDFIIKRRCKVLKETREDLIKFLQKHVDKWRERLKKSSPQQDTGTGIMNRSSRSKSKTPRRSIRHSSPLDNLAYSNCFVVLKRL